MEKALIDFHIKVAEGSDLTEAKRLHIRSSKWETVHLDQLDKIHTLLQDEWWEKQQFSTD